MVAVVFSKTASQLRGDIRKLITEALDSGTPNAEAAKLAAQAVLLARTAGFTAEQYGNATCGRVPDGAMPFGKYRGKPLADVAREDPAYLQWLLETCHLGSGMQRQISELLNATPVKS